MRDLPSTPVPNLSSRPPALRYSISSLRKLGVSLPVRGIILLFFAFMPMFSNYAALLTKDVLFADAFLVLPF